MVVQCHITGMFQQMFNAIEVLCGRPLCSLLLQQPDRHNTYEIQTNRVRYPYVPRRVAQNENFLHLALPFISSSQIIVDISNLIYGLIIASPSLWTTIVPDRGVVRSCDPLQNFWGSIHITGMAESKVVKFCTQVGYGHVTV